MNISGEGRKLVQLFEKLKLSPYVDSVGIWTIGWGHALRTPDGHLIDQRAFGVAKAMELAREAMQKKYGAWTITEAQADDTFTEDVAPREQSLSNSIGEDNATQAQFDGLFSFVFNLGEGAFDSSTVRTLHMNDKREIGNVSFPDLWEKAKTHATPVNMPIAFVRWSNAGGQLSLGVFRRRLSEMLVYSGWDAQRAYDTAYQFTP